MAVSEVTITKGMTDAAAAVLGYSVEGLVASKARSLLRYQNAVAAAAAKGGPLTAKEAHNLIAGNLASWYPGVKVIA